MAWTIWIFVKLRVLSQLLVNSCEVKHLVNDLSQCAFTAYILYFSTSIYCISLQREEEKIHSQKKCKNKGGQYSNKIAPSGRCAAATVTLFTCQNPLAPLIREQALTRVQDTPPGYEELQ